MDQRIADKFAARGGVMYETGTKAVGVPRPTPAPSFWERNTKKILGGVLLLVFLHDLFGAHGLLALARTRNEITALRLQIDQLDRENQTLEKQVKDLKTDPRVIERIAREEMGLAKKGEKIYKTAPPAAPSTSGQPYGKP